MRKKVDDPRLMIKVCDLYYNQNASRQEIGQELGLSRPTIARLLDSAREQGLVRIEIPDLDTIAYWELEKKLEGKYGLRQVLVVDGSDDKDTLESALGSSAARYLQYVIKMCIRDRCYPRSGLGFKYRLQLNNTVGIIDSDYYYSDNEGHIFAKITNDSNEDKTVELKAGNGFMQGIFVEYGITVDDNVQTVRNGGFGLSLIHILLWRFYYWGFVQRI